MVTCFYHFVQRFLSSFSSLSFRYVLFPLFALLCTLCMRFWYALFLCTFFMCSIYVLFVFTFLCTLVCACYIHSLNALFLCSLLHWIRIEELKLSKKPQARLNSRITAEQQTKNRQIYGNDHAIFEILHKLGLNMVINLILRW